MKQRKIAISLFALGIPVLASLSVAQPVNGPVALFGIQIGARLPDTREHVFVEEDATTLHYILRNTTNPDYLIQKRECLETVADRRLD
jgi:hypothetical protein